MTLQPFKHDGVDWANIQDKKYPGYGQCIYCGSAGGIEGLRDEHMMPLSMGGRTVIEKACCRICEATLTNLDRHLARSVFGNFRIHSDAATRRPENRPKVLPATILIDGQRKTLELPIEQHPYTLAMPVWGVAGVMRGAKIDAPFPEVNHRLYHWMPPNLRETLGLTAKQELKIESTGTVDPYMFGRGLAKIAYCHAVTRYGLNGFRPLTIPDLILGRFPHVPYFVGAPTHPPVATMEMGQKHAIVFHEISTTPSREFGLVLLVASIRLFADSGTEHHGMPTYHVIVGSPGKPRALSRKPLVVTPKLINL